MVSVRRVAYPGFRSPPDIHLPLFLRTSAPSRDAGIDWNNLHNPRSPSVTDLNAFLTKSTLKFDLDQCPTRGSVIKCSHIG